MEVWLDRLRTSRINRSMPKMADHQPILNPKNYLLNSIGEWPGEKATLGALRALLAGLAKQGGSDDRVYDSLLALPCRHLVALDCCFAGVFRWSSFRHLVLAPAFWDLQLQLAVGNAIV